MNKVGDGGNKVAKKVLPEKVSKKMFIDPREVISPLLMVDSDGRSPLHLACIHKAPESLLLTLLEKEKKATTIKDNNGHQALHTAIESWQYDHVIERLVKTNPHALKSKDNKGRTPVSFAVEIARKGRKEDVPEDPDDPFLWISPTSAKEKDWQFEQESRWAKVKCLLKELVKRDKAVIPSEHGLILEALEAGADPTTIIPFISSTAKYMLVDDELAGMAIGLCVERLYNVETLAYLLKNCREGTTIITDIVQKALKTHYLLGCYPLREGMVPFGKRIIDWAKKRAKEEKKKAREEKLRKEEEEKEEEQKNKLESKKSVRFLDEEESTEDVADDGVDEDKWEGMKVTCRDWWEIMNHILFYCAYGRDYEENVKPEIFHLLHAALACPTTPPSLVHLLLIVYPEAIMEKCPVYSVFPIHIACTKWRYNVIHSGGDVSSLDQVLLNMIEADPNQVFQRHKGSLPIHMALFGGHSWAFVRPLISSEKNLLGMRDAQSKLFPFQLAALPMRFRNVQLLMRYQFNPTVWREMPLADKKENYEKLVVDQELRQLNTIYELLRAYPGAIEKRLLFKNPRGASQSSLSELSLHYLSWVYGRASKGGYRVRYANLTALRNSILKGEVVPEMEEWWNKLKLIIWDNSHKEIPRTNVYLLHSALYNSETPPLLTELLIQLSPRSAAKPLPGTSTYPLHIAAGTASYHRQQFEIPYGVSNLLLVLKSYKQASRFKSNGRLPLHICLARGKIWEEVRPLIMVNPWSLKVEDEQTGLVPFELIASFKLAAKENSLWYSAFTEKQIKTFEFYQLSSEEKAKVLSNARKDQSLTQLSCIFEMIRSRPSVLTMRFFGLTAENDDESVNSLNSFVEDGYEREEQPEGLDMLEVEPQGSDLEVVSPLEFDHSLSNLYAGGDGPGLLSPHNSTQNLSASVAAEENELSEPVT